MSIARVVGVGHPNHGDDAAGLLIAAEAARLLGPLAVLAEETGTGVGLLDPDAPADLLVIVDAAQETEGFPAGTWRLFDLPESGTLPAESSLRDAHGLSIPGMIRLGRTLGYFPAEVKIYAVAGRAFLPETGLSPPVLASLGTVAARIAEDVRRRMETSLPGGLRT